MMRKTVIVCTAMLLSAVFIVPAFAAPAVWTDSIGKTDSPVYLSESSRDYYHFDLDITKTGFDPGLDNVYEYSLTIELSDDGDCVHEWAYVNLPGLSSDRIIEVDYDNYGFEMSFQGLSDLNKTGILGVSLYAIAGDFFFLGSQIEAGGNSVPLPGSILLLGTGLLGLTGIRHFLRKFSF